MKKIVTNILPLYSDTDNTWDYYELEEDLYEDIIDEDRQFLCELHNKYHTGNIVMVNHAVRDDGDIVKTPHRIMIITNAIVDAETTKYTGYLLSSKIKQSNKYSNNKNNLYIQNYKSILRDRQSYDSDVECYINVNNLFSFTSDDIEGNGYKGQVTNEFWHFVMSAKDNIKNGISNENNFWVTAVNEGMSNTQQYYRLVLIDSNGAEKSFFIELGKYLKQLWDEDNEIYDDFNYALSRLEYVMDVPDLDYNNKHFNFAFTKEAIEKYKDEIDEVEYYIHNYSPYEMKMYEVHPQKIVYSDEVQIAYEI